MRHTLEIVRARNVTAVASGPPDVVAKWKTGRRKPHIAGDSFGSIIAVHLATDAVLVPIIAVDTYRRRRLHPVFLWGTLFILTIHFSAIWISSTVTWQSLARRILNFFYS